MDKWQCPECGEQISKDLSLCACGYNENDTDNEQLQTKLPATPHKKSKDVPLRKVLYKILKFVVLFHLIAYAVLIGKQTAGRPHFIGKSLMLGAMWITKIYVVPVSKIVGPYSPLTKPFYFVRDSFYNLGWMALPEDDAERHMWWYGVKFSSEYCELVGDEIVAYRLGKPYKLSPALFNDWTNDLYKHLDPLATLPLKDKKFQENRLFCFIGVASRYVTGRSNFVGKYYNNVSYILENPVENSKLRSIFDNYLKLKDFSEKNEIKGYEKVFQKNDVELYLTSSFINGLTAKIIYNDLYVQGSDMNCESALIIEHMKARKMMLEAKQIEVSPLNLSKAIKRYKESVDRQLAYKKIKESCNVDQYEPKPINMVSEL